MGVGRVRSKKKIISGYYGKGWEEMCKILILKFLEFDYCKFWYWICGIFIVEIMKYKFEFCLFDFNLMFYIFNILNLK